MNLVGKLVRFQTTHSDASTITYHARIVKIEGDIVWVEIPAKVRNLPFPPLNGHRYGSFRIADISHAIIA